MLSGRDAKENTDQGSVRSIALQIREEKGLQGFWSGYSASLILTLNPSLTFFFFEALKRSLLPRSKRSDPPPQTIFLLAAISKAMASTITYPFSLAKSRLQASTSKDQEADSTSVKLEPQSQRPVPRNVFTTIMQIAQTEGLGALYEGLGGEVMKGFFSHGITMIVKDAAHKLVIHLYYAILKLLKKYPSPQEMAGAAKDRAGEMAGQAVERTQEVAAAAQSQASTVAGNVSELAQNVASSAQEEVHTIFEEAVGLVVVVKERVNGDDT